MVFFNLHDISNNNPADENGNSNTIQSLISSDDVITNVGNGRFLKELTSSIEYGEIMKGTKCSKRSEKTLIVACKRGFCLMRNNLSHYKMRYRIYFGNPEKVTTGTETLKDKIEIGKYCTRANALSLMPCQ